MLQLKSVEFVFENTEGFEISGEYIGVMRLCDLITEIRKHDDKYNELRIYNTANEFALEIKKTADEGYNPFDIEDLHTTKFNRFTIHNDLVSVILKCYDDVHNEDHEYQYYVYWEFDAEGSSDECNLAQKTYISKTGNLYIVVHKDKGIEDFFTKIVIDNGE